MLLSPRVLKSPNSIERIQRRMLCASFNDNPNSTVISCYSPINANEETDITTFYSKLYSLVHNIPKNNVQIIRVYMNAHIGKDKNNEFCQHNSLNRNEEYLADFLLENKLIIIIMSCHQHGYPWPSLATSPFGRSSLLLLAGLQGCIPYPHRAAVCMFEPVVLLLLGHMWGSIGVKKGRENYGQHRSK